MEQKTKELFKKHFNRMQDDLFQVNGFSLAMQKLIKSNLSNLETDIIKLHGVNDDETITTKWERTSTK